MHLGQSASVRATRSGRRASVPVLRGGFRVSGFGFRVSGFGFLVPGFTLRVAVFGGKRFPLMEKPFSGIATKEGAREDAR